MQLVPLELMATGESGIVRDVEGTPEVVVRLREMGLREGAEIRMIKTGSPCLLAVNDQRFLFRIDKTATVWVELLS
jgi:ferrous iron transport protein A